MEFQHQCKTNIASTKWYGYVKDNAGNRETIAVGLPVQNNAATHYCTDGAGSSISITGSYNVQYYSVIHHVELQVIILVEYQVGE